MSKKRSCSGQCGQDNTLLTHLSELMQALQDVTDDNSAESAPAAPEKELFMDRSPIKRKFKKRGRAHCHSEAEIENVKMNKSETISARRSPMAFCEFPDAGKYPINLTTPEITVDPNSESDNDHRKARRSNRQFTKPMLIPFDMQIPGTSKMKINAKKLLHPSFVAESDSYTDSLPCKSTHKKKRLVKKMAVDPIQDETFSPTDRDVAMMCVRARKSTRAFSNASECSMECEVEDSCLSSSGSDGEASDDGGRLGDDEQSDWLFEPVVHADDEYMGVPRLDWCSLVNNHIHKMSIADNDNRSDEETTPKETDDSNQTTIEEPGCKKLAVESSDTDMSQCNLFVPSTSQKFGGPEKVITKHHTKQAHAINKKIVQFLRDAGQSELRVSKLRKVERKQVRMSLILDYFNKRSIDEYFELLQLCHFYRIEVSCDPRRRTVAFLLRKNMSTRIP